MEITVKVDAPELAQSIQSLADAMNHGGAAVAAPPVTKTPDPAPQKEEPQQQKEESKQEEEPQQEEQSKQEPSKEEPAQEQSETKEEQEQEYTLQDVRGVLAELSQDGKQPQVKEIIQSFGGQKLGDIDPAKYPEVMAEAEKLK